MTPLKSQIRLRLAAASLSFLSLTSTPSHASSKSGINFHRLWRPEVVEPLFQGGALRNDLSQINFTLSNLQDSGVDFYRTSREVYWPRGLNRIEGLREVFNQAYEDAFPQLRHPDLIEKLLMATFYSIRFKCNNLNDFRLQSIKDEMISMAKSASTFLETHSF